MIVTQSCAHPSFAKDVERAPQTGIPQGPGSARSSVRGGVGGGPRYLLRVQKERNAREIKENRQMSVKNIETPNSATAQLPIIFEEVEDGEGTAPKIQPPENDVDEKVQEAVAQFRATTLQYFADCRGPHLDPTIPKTQEGRKYMN